MEHKAPAGRDTGGGLCVMATGASTCASLRAGRRTCSLRSRRIECRAVVVRNDPPPTRGSYLPRNCSWTQRARNQRRAAKRLYTVTSPARKSLIQAVSQGLRQGMSQGEGAWKFPDLLDAHGNY